MTLVVANKKMLVENWQIREKLELKATREGFSEGLLEAGKKERNIVAICADLTGSVMMNKFAQAFPDRFIQVGVAEQNMAGVGAGLALSGKIAFIGSFAVFNPGRNWEQIRISVCYNQANVKIIGSHSGVSVGEDGATHQALEDIAITRCLPNMTVIQPVDFLEAKKATLAIAKKKGSCYLRLCRIKTPLFTAKNSVFKIGKADILLTGQDVTIIGCGPILYEALQAADKLRRLGIKATVINCHTIKPFDEKTIIKFAKLTRAVVTVEEHQIFGGLGSAVAEVLAKNCPVPQEFVGIKDKFGQSGTAEKLFKQYGLTAKDIIKAVKGVLKRKIR